MNKKDFINSENRLHKDTKSLEELAKRFTPKQLAICTNFVQMVANVEQVIDTVDSSLSTSMIKLLETLINHIQASQSKK
ncbi:MAG: hypothetical protein AB8B67_03545 [Rickettsiaceae bacterium]